MESFEHINHNIIRKSHNDIYCSKNDEKEYRTFTLSNGLQVFMVGNSGTEQSSACITVGAGHTDNYPDKLGIAHFLEHMLFLGTEKYPKENAYSNFIQHNGGICNAYTSEDITCYYFTINKDKFIRALDMFAQFFISPLLKQESVRAEVTAVNAEHKKNMAQDMWRIYDVTKKTMNKDHEFSRFGTGSFKTLLGVDEKEDITEDKVIELMDALRKFFNEKYSARNMKLFIYHNNIDEIEMEDTPIEDIEGDIVSESSSIPPIPKSSTLTELVTNIFGEVTEKVDMSPRDKTKSFIAPHPGRYPIIKVEPIGDISILKIHWIIEMDNIRKGDKLVNTDICADLITYLLGHEGNGTLYELLKKKQWVIKLYANPSEFTVDKNVVMSVDITLTDKGIKHIDEIKDYIYAFIEYIKLNINKNKDYYLKMINEILIKRKLSLKNERTVDPDSHLQEYAKICDRYEIDMKYINVIDIMVNEDSTALINGLKDVINKMVMENSSVVKAYTDIELGEGVTIDPNYGTKYVIEWVEVNNYEKDFINSLKYFPNSNEFITFDLLSIDLNSVFEKDDSDRIKKADNSHDMYYDINNIFKEDKVYLIAKLELTLLREHRDVKKYVSLLVYLNYLNLINNSEMYDLSMGLCDVDILSAGMSILINISTYPQHFIKTIDKTLNWLFNTDISSQEMIDIIRKQVKRNINNAKLSPPYSKLGIIINEKFKSKCTIARDDILNTLDTIELSEIKDTALELISELHIRSIITGNITEAIAINACEKFNRKFKFKRYNTIECSNNISKSITYVESNSNELDKNSAIKMLIKYGDFQIGKTKDWAKDFCIMDMLSTVMHNEYFHYMRTTWSLGYIANVSFTNMNTLSNRKYFINMLMQSPELDPEGLYEKTIGLIRNQIKKKIESLTPTEFISIKLGLHSSFKIPDHNIMDRLNRLFDAIICKHDNTEPMFDIKDKLINSLMGDDAINIEESGITKDDIISKYNDMITDPTIITIGIKPQ